MQEKSQVDIKGKNAKITSKYMNIFECKVKTRDTYADENLHDCQKKKKTEKLNKKCKEK